jgi:hypothetical protein
MLESQFTFDLAYRLSAPTVVWPGLETSIPEHLKEKAKFARLAQAPFPTTATDEEALVYMHTASLAQPFSHESYNIYMYLFGKFFPEQAKVLGNEVTELSITEKRALDVLKAWIFKQQKTAIKAKLAE